MEATNKAEGLFSTFDEYIATKFAALVGMPLQNAIRFHVTETARLRSRHILDLIRNMQLEISQPTFVSTISQRLCKILEADKCTLYFSDNVRRALFLMQGEVSILI